MELYFYSFRNLLVRKDCRVRFFEMEGDKDGRRQTRREGLRLCRAKHGSRHKGRLNLPPIDFHGLLLLPLRLFFKEISKFGTGIHTRACKSRPCRMQNGTSVASPFFPPTRNRFPAFRKKKKKTGRGEKKHNNPYGRARMPGRFGNRQRRPDGIPA